MKIIINTNDLKDKGLTPDVLLYLVSLYLEAPITAHTIKVTQNKGYSAGAGLDKVISEEGKNLVEETFEVCTEDTGRFERLADRLRDLYPSGRKPGTSYMWKDSTAIIARKLKSLVKKYGNCFTDEQAVEATRKYIDSFNGNYTYMQLLKYFISKRTIIDGETEETSQLLSFIENEGQENINEDWNTELK